MEHRLTQIEEESKTILKKLKQSKEPEDLDCLLRRYVQVRYQLEDEDLVLNSFNSLGLASIARETGADLDAVISEDLNVRCDSASPALTKKILLIIALNRELSLGISPEEAAEITTVSALSKRLARSIFGISTHEQ